MIIRLKGLMLSSALRLQRRTWRVSMQGREHLDRLYADQKRFLLCFWHGKYVPIFSLMEGYQACVLSSRSERGSIIAEICRNFGYQTALIPDQLTGDSFRLMRESLSEARAAGVAADGPLGPRHQVKGGVIWMASALGFDLLPVSVDSRRKMIYKKRWDRMEIPLPFTTVSLVVGEPIKVPPKLGPGQIRLWMDKLAKAIDIQDNKAESMIVK